MEQDHKKKKTTTELLSSQLLNCMSVLTIVPLNYPIKKIYSEALNIKKNQKYHTTNYKNPKNLIICFSVHLSSKDRSLTFRGHQCACTQCSNTKSFSSKKVRVINGWMIKSGFSNPNSSCCHVLIFTNTSIS